MVIKEERTLELIREICDLKGQSTEHDRAAAFCEVCALLGVPFVLRDGPTAPRLEETTTLEFQANGEHALLLTRPLLWVRNLTEFKIYARISSNDDGRRMKFSIAEIEPMPGAIWPE